MMSTGDESNKAGWESNFAGPPTWQHALPAAAIVAATFIAYSATLSLGFVSDDQLQIVANPSIASWKFVPQYFSGHVWSYIYPHLLSNYYRPFFLLWLRVNEALFGPYAWGWHLTSVLLHLAVTYLVYRLAQRLGLDAWGAAAAALIFGLHPVHAEAVAYVSAVPELLSALFVLGALLAWLRWRESGSRRGWLVVALTACAAALLAKESGMTLPVFVALYAGICAAGEDVRVRPATRLGAALLAAAPFLGVTLAYVPLRIWALKGFAHTVTQVALRTEILTIPSVLVFYVRLLLWPVPLSCYYDLPYVSAATMRSFFLPLAGVLGIMAVVVGWYRWMRGTRPREAGRLVFAAMWVVVAILPVLNFRMLPEGEIVHDRYLYLPSVGFSLLLGMAVDRGVRAQERIRRRSAAVAVVTVLACLIVGFATLRQTLYWSDDLSLNFHAHEIAPHSVAATTSLAAAVANRGMDGTAIALYQQALALQPQFWRANVNLAYLYYAHGDFPQAARFFARACAADPTDGDQFLYLGMAEMQLHQLSQAEAAVRTAMLVRPHGKDYHLGLGLVLKQEGKLREAREEFAAALADDPKDKRAESLLAETDRLLKAQPETSALPPP